MGGEEEEGEEGEEEEEEEAEEGLTVCKTTSENRKRGVIESLSNRDLNTFLMESESGRSLLKFALIRSLYLTRACFVLPSLQDCRNKSNSAH